MEIFIYLKNTHTSFSYPEVAYKISVNIIIIMERDNVRMIEISKAAFKLTEILLCNL